MTDTSKAGLPSEAVELPSKGLVYPKENPLSSGVVEMKYMTAREEDILTNQNFIKQGVVFDKLLRSLIVSPINYDDLTLGDKNAILIAGRILGYGKQYVVSVTHPQTGEPEEVSIDLTAIKNKEVDYSALANINEFTYQLPTSNNEVTFKILTHKDERMIEEELKSLKKLNMYNDVTVRLKHAIIAINGDRDAKAVRDFVDNHMLATDSRAFRKHMREITPDLNLTINIEFKDGYIQEGVDLPLGISFFYPSTEL